MGNLGRVLVLTTIAIAMFTVLALADADGVQTPSAEIFFAGGGPLTRLAFLNLSELNEALPGTEFSGDLNFGGRQAFLLQGSLGFGGGDLRFGGVDAQGTWTAPVTGGAFDQAELKLSYGGFLFEALLNPTSRLPLFAGGIIGSGKLSLLLSRGAEGTFADLTGKPLLLELSRPYFALQPYLGTEFKLLNFLGLKLEVGMLFAFSSREWLLPDRTRAKDGPLKLITAPLIGIALIFGG